MGQSNAAVFDTDAYAPRDMLSAHHFNRALRTVVFDRIGKQVDQNLN
jgi:hypothetical protein